MKILGLPNDDNNKLIVKSWTADITCSKDNCGARLRVEADDVKGIKFIQEGIYSSKVFGFKCPCCNHKIYIPVSSVDPVVRQYMVKKLIKDNKVKAEDPIITNL